MPQPLLDGGHSVSVPCHVAGTPYISGQRNTDRPECAAANLNCDQHTRCDLNCDSCSKVTNRAIKQNRFV